MGAKERAELRKKRIVAHCAGNFDDAERWDIEFWQNQSPDMRLSALITIRNDIRKARRGRKIDWEA